MEKFVSRWVMLGRRQQLLTFRLHLKRSGNHFTRSTKVIGGLTHSCFSCCLCCEASLLAFDSLCFLHCLFWSIFGVAFGNCVSLLSGFGLLCWLLGFATTFHYFRWWFFWLVNNIGHGLRRGDRFFCRLELIDLSCHIRDQLVLRVDDRTTWFSLSLQLID